MLKHQKSLSNQSASSAALCIELPTDGALTCDSQDRSTEHQGIVRHVVGTCRSLVSPGQPGKALPGSPGASASSVTEAAGLPAAGEGPPPGIGATAESDGKGPGASGRIGSGRTPETQQCVLICAHVKKVSRTWKRASNLVIAQTEAWHLDASIPSIRAFRVSR